jgi:hypothetical protein
LPIRNQVELDFRLRQRQAHQRGENRALVRLERVVAIGHRFLDQRSVPKLDP